MSTGPSMNMGVTPLSMIPNGNGIGGIPPNNIHNVGVPVQQNIVPVDLPFPETVETLNTYLRRARELFEVDSHPSEKLGILKVLEQVDKQHAKYETDIQELTDQFSKLTKEEIDTDLLEKQIVSLQLLAKDLDIPLEYQYQFAQDYFEEENDQLAIKGSSEEDKDSKSQDSVSKLFKLPLGKYETKAKLLGLQTDLPFPNADYDSVGLPSVEAVVSKKIANRMIELEMLPSNIGTFDSGKVENDFVSSDSVIKGVDELKIKALVELKSLRLLSKQKQLRRYMVLTASQQSHQSVDYLNRYPTVMSAERLSQIRTKIIAPQTARLAEQLEEQQKQEKRKLELKRQRERVASIISICEDVDNELQTRKLTRAAIGKSISQYHLQVERDESKKLERTAKQRLQALKSNDEEAYLKLLDQTKDTRITHLLKQTNSFLDSLANAVKVQQAETKILHNAGKPVQEEEEDDEKLDEADQDAKRESIDYYEVAHKVKETITQQPSILVGGKLKEYQLKGLEWMVSLYNNHLNGILADEMGLGKTIQSISLITYLIESKKEKGKFLVLVPLSTITNWTLEFEKWAPSVKTVVYKGTQQQRKQLEFEIRSGNFTVLLTTYEYIIRDRPLLSKFKWAHMIIDEGHRMKNAKSKLSVTLTQFYSTKNRLILTGTPLQNNLPELWALLNFVLPKVFNSVKSFDEWFNTPFANTGHQDKLELSEEESLLIIRRLHKVLRPFLLRRLKRDVEKDLPDKVEKVVKCKLSGLQSSMYKQLLQHNALFIGAGATGATKSGLKGLNNKIMQLRKICNHPFVFEEVENVINPEKATTELIWRSSGKFELLDRVLPKFKATGHRVLIFFQMTQVMDIMEDYLRFKGMKYMRLDGSTKADDRQLMLKDFNAPDSEYFCFLLSTRAGGLGLNLQTADTVIIFDTDWNPHQDLQAQDRAHRIGQKNEVRILRLITDDSVEEVILERAHQKLDIDGKVIQAGKFDNKSSAEEQEAFLKRLLEAEKDKGEGDDEEDLDDDDLNDVLARSEEEKELFAKIDEERLIQDRIDAKENHRPFTRLLGAEELPEIFNEDISARIKEAEHTDLSRQRERKKVYYDDGLTEEQWLQAMDDDEDSVEAAIERKRQALQKRRATMSRKRALENGEDEDDDEEEESETPSSKRRSRRAATPASFNEDNSGEEDEGDNKDDAFVKPCLDLLKALTELEDSEGRLRSELFMAVPSRKLYPDYYQLIKKPTSINDLKRKLNQGKFESFDEFKENLQLMFDNAKIYNEEGSFVYEDAVVMEDFVNGKLAKLSF